MRILSQENLYHIDLPYENVGLSISARDRKTIVAYPSGNYKAGDGFWTMAEYSTEEKAKKAMVMLWKAYSPIAVIQEQGNGIKPNIKPNDWVIQTDLPMPKVEFLDNFYFQFPADDEVEV